jgi:uncharacterized protein
MLKDEVISRLQAHQSDLKAKGFLHVGLFGSIARGDETEESDVDLVVELDRSNVPGVFAFVRILLDLEEILGRKVDAVTLPIRKDRLRAAVERDRIDAF